MHIEILVEDLSGAKLLELLLPRLVGPYAEPNTWNVHAYRGIGRLPAGLQAKQDPAKRALLNQLPRVLAGYGKTPGIDAVIVVLDNDRRDTRVFLKELSAVLKACDPAPNAVFRIAVEEMEAWLLGDRSALLHAYPKAKKDVLAKYEQDSLCDTWELLADAIYPGGRHAIISAGWPLPGVIKSEWATNIGPHMDVESNASPSFAEFREGIRNMAEY